MDWELIIHKEERTMEVLKQIVRKVYSSLKMTEKALVTEYDNIEEILRMKYILLLLKN